MDIYDHYHDWDAMMTGDAGLVDLRNFAKLHGKLEAYTEWARSVLTNGHGDNADFVRAMWDWMASRPGKVLYQAYWNSDDGTGGHLVGSLASELVEAADTFRDLFGPNTAPTVTPLADRTIGINADTGRCRSRSETTSFRPNSSRWSPGLPIRICFRRAGSSSPATARTAPSRCDPRRTRPVGRRSGSRLVTATSAAARPSW
jgi:hypothetical protein